MASPSLPEALVTAEDISNLQISTHGRALQRSFVKGLLVISSAGHLFASQSRHRVVCVDRACALVDCLPRTEASPGGDTGILKRDGRKRHDLSLGFRGERIGIHHFVVLSTFFALYPAVWCAGISWLNSIGTR